MSYPPPAGYPRVPQAMPPQRGRNRAVVPVVIIGAAVLIIALVAVIAVLVIPSNSSATAVISDDSSSGDGEPDSPGDAEERDGPAVDDGLPRLPTTIETLEIGEPTETEPTEDCDYEPVPDEQVQDRGQRLTDVGAPDDGAKPASGTQTMDIATNHGDISISLDLEKAPCTAASFTHLSGEQFFDDTECHRLTTELLYVLQCGDPSGDGSGGPTYQFDNEYEPEDTAEDLSQADRAEGAIPEPNYEAGTVAMANSGPDANGSQFFINYEASYLPPDYTIFGTVTEGLDIVEDIAAAGAVADEPN